jgi:hypothetical protein
LIESINLGRSLALTTTGEVVPITNMFDMDGDDTNDPAEAVAITAGPTASGEWLSDAVTNFNFNTKH